MLAKSVFGFASEESNYLKEPEWAMTGVTQFVDSHVL